MATPTPAPIGGYRNLFKGAEGEQGPQELYDTLNEKLRDPQTFKIWFDITFNHLAAYIMCKKWGPGFLITAINNETREETKSSPDEEMSLSDEFRLEYDPTNYKFRTEAAQVEGVDPPQNPPARGFPPDSPLASLFKLIDRKLDYEVNEYRGYTHVQLAPWFDCYVRDYCDGVKAELDRHGITMEYPTSWRRKESTST